MTYPQYLLPQPNYKKIEWSNNLGKCTLVRHTDSQDIFMIGTQTIDVGKIKFPSEHFRNDLSTNLLSVFNLENVYIQVINNDFTNDWLIGQTVSSPTFKEDFIINRNRGYFALIIEDILNLNATPPLIENGLSFEVLHTPTKCNFWHFSIRVSKNNVLVGNLDISDKQKTKLWRKAKTLIFNLVYYIEGETSVLLEEHYITN